MLRSLQNSGKRLAFVLGRQQQPQHFPKLANFSSSAASLNLEIEHTTTLPPQIDVLADQGVPKDNTAASDSLSGAVEATDSSTVDPVPSLSDAFGRFYGTGRRKTSSARVWVKEGSGEFHVNNQEITKYFQPIQREEAILPFVMSKTAGLFDVWCTVKGGGISGQAGAVRLGVSRALAFANPELRTPLKRAGLLSRDARRVERKKIGQKKARKKFQWVKR